MDKFFICENINIFGYMGGGGEGRNEITRLLGRPQPQMYPPVALNQYTWVKRTPKHFFIYRYASRPHENFEIAFTPKLSSQQHVKYGSNLMKICY